MFEYVHWQKVSKNQFLLKPDPQNDHSEQLWDDVLIKYGCKASIGNVIVFDIYKRCSDID